MWELDLALVPGAVPVAPTLAIRSRCTERVERVERVKRVERVPSPELGDLFSAYERPPKRAKSAPPPVAKPAREIVPYAMRIVARPRAPFDRQHPFRNAGLMREIGGVHGFMGLVRGTHRIVDEWETTSETLAF